MNRDGHNNVKFFIGPEVEHTPANSKRTLFVVGKQPVGDIVKIAREQRVTHIFMGANHSFNSESQDMYWDTVITELLDRGFWVTLDYQAHQHVDVLKMLNAGIWQCRNFVPLLGVRIPKVQNSSPNLTIKIDDIDFAATNAGVWCLHHHEVTDSNRFTDWRDYESDQVLQTENERLVMTPMPGPGLPELRLPDMAPEVGETNKDAEMNPQDLGLDPDPKIASEVEKVLTANTTPVQTAEAYAEAGAATEKKGKKK